MSKKLGMLGATIVTTALLVAVSVPVASAAQGGPVWEISQRTSPTNLPPGGSGTYLISLRNLGEAASVPDATVEVTLPEGVTASGGGGFLWECPAAVGASVVTCTLLSETYPFPVPPHGEAFAPLSIPVEVDPNVSGVRMSTATVTGGGATSPASSTIATSFTSDPAGFGVTRFSGGTTNRDGTPARQAGSHPDLTTMIEFNTARDGSGNVGVAGNVKDVHVDLPRGLVGDPTAVPTCDPVLLAVAAGPQCAAESQVGTAVLISGNGGPFPLTPVYNITAPVGSPARLGFNVVGVVVNIDPRVRSGDYGITADVSNSSQSLAVSSARITLWGIPADPIHDEQRRVTGSEFEENGASSASPRVPFLTAPTACSGVALATKATVTSWQEPGTEHSASFDTDYTGAAITTEGCNALAFNPQISVQPESPAKRGAPAGLGIDLTLPQNQSPDGLATANLRKAVVVLPEGMAVNTSSVEGLQACTPGQIDLAGAGKANCPLASKIGSVQVETPLLEESLQGAIYLAAQRDNPFGSTLALYLVVEGSGVVLKLPGKIETDPRSGQVTTSFDDNPQLPFERLSVRLKTGPRAPLKMPTSCGPATTTAVLTPWSGAPPVTVRSSFDVSGDGNGGPCAPQGFNPKLNAGTTNPVAGSFSPFALQLSRGEDEAEFSAISSLNLPQGLTATLKGIPYCSDATLSGVSDVEGTGAAQLASPSCPTASQIGTVSVGAGAGPSPFYVNSGKAYLAGPYKGAPLSIAFVTPAVAGPFDLGNVVVRAALQVDPSTAQITAVSDPLPTILYGIPLNLRDIRVNIDRSDFTINPTSCDPMSVDGTITSAAGQSANVSSRFQVGSCERLAFKPSLKLKVSGATKRGKYPKLRAELRAKPGEANIGRVSVALPHSEFLAQEHIKTICTRVQFAAEQCPAGSIYGKATAWSPLLDKPLSGPVYLRSSSNPLPDLVVALKGQIDIDLSGRIDSVNGGIRNSFEMVPDAPVSKFVLEMQGGKKGLLVNSRNLCAKGAGKATVKMTGQNGKAHDFNPVLGSSCGGKSRKKGK